MASEQSAREAAKWLNFDRPMSPTAQKGVDELATLLDESKNALIDKILSGKVSAAAIAKLKVKT